MILTLIGSLVTVELDDSAQSCGTHFVTKTVVTPTRTRAVHASQKPDPTNGAFASGIARTTAFAVRYRANGAALQVKLT
jgi:hypothetical protein